MDFMKDVVNIQITNVTGNTNTADLNTIMILAQHSAFTAPELFREAGSATDAKAMGFDEKSYVYRAVQTAFAQSPSPTKVLIGAGVAVDGSYVDMFDRLQMTKAGWLWLVSDLRDTAKQIELAKAVGGTEKFYAVGSNDITALDSSKATDVGSLLIKENIARAYAWYDDEEDGVNASEIALVARCSTRVAGTIQFTLKELNNVSIADTITSKTHITTLISKGYTFLANGNGKAYSYGAGTLGNGWIIDIGLAITWLQVRMRERIFNTVTGADKLGMDADGAGVVESDIRAVIAEGKELGIVAKDSPVVVSVPNVATLARAVRAGRILPNVYFNVRLTGGIAGVQVRGEVYE